MSSFLISLPGGEKKEKKNMLSFHFSSVEAIWIMSQDCTPISAHTDVLLSRLAAAPRWSRTLMEFKSGRGAFP